MLHGKRSQPCLSQGHEEPELPSQEEIQQQLDDYKQLSEMFELAVREGTKLEAENEMLKSQLSQSASREENFKQLLTVKDSEISNLSSKMTDLAKKLEKLSENELKLQQVLKKLNKSSEQMIQLQAAKQPDQVKPGIGTHSLTSGIEGKEKVVPEKASVDKSRAYHNLPDKQVKLRSPVRQPQTILVKEIAKSVTKNQQLKHADVKHKVATPRKLHNKAINQLGGQPDQKKRTARRRAVHKQRTQLARYQRNNYFEQYSYFPNNDNEGYWYNNNWHQYPESSHAGFDQIPQKGGFENFYCRCGYREPSYQEFSQPAHYPQFAHNHADFYWNDQTWKRPHSNKRRFQKKETGNQAAKSLTANSAPKQVWVAKYV